jgi:hypothetical protein
MGNLADSVVLLYLPSTSNIASSCDSQDDRMLMIEVSGFQNVMTLTNNDGEKLSACGGAEEASDSI